MQFDLSDKPGSVKKLLERMEAFIRDTGMSESEFANSVGSSNALFKNLRKGSMPSVERLHAILNELSETLVLGDTSMDEAQNRVLSVDADNIHFSNVAKFDANAADHAEPDRPPDKTPGWTAFSSRRTLPRRGIASCSVKGWGKAQPLGDPLPAPEELEDPEAFYVSASGQSMIPEGIDNGDTVLVSPGKTVEIGDRVWITTFQSETSLKRLIEIKQDTVVVQGWMPIRDGRQQSFTEEHVRAYLKRLAPVLAVYEGRPGKDDVRYKPDPRRPAPSGAVSDDLANDYALIKMHPLQQAVDGGSVLADKSVAAAIAFPKDWLRHHAIVPSQASLIALEGDDMAPTFDDATVVLVNHARRRVQPKRVYAFLRDDVMELKRLEMLSERQLLIQSDNPRYPSVLLNDAQLKNVEIIGEVVWAGKNFHQAQIATDKPTHAKSRACSQLSP